MRRLAFAAAAALLLGALALRVALVRDRYVNTDETVHLHAALLVAHGNVPFRDFFAHHGPLFWAVLAPVVARFDGSFAAIEAGRVLMTLAWLGLLALAARPRADADPLEGAAAAVMLAFFGAFAVKSVEIRPDVPATLLLSGALASAATRRRGAGAWTGAFLALGAWCSPKIVFAAVGLLAGALWRRRESKAAARAFVLQFFCSAAAVAALGFCWLAAHRALGPMWDLYVVFNARFRSGAAAWPTTLRPSLSSDPLVWALGLAGLARARRRPEEAGVLLAALGGLFVSPSAYPQYLLFVAPALCALAASALDGWARAGRDGARRAALAGVVVAAACARPAAAALALVSEGNELQRERYACVDARVPADAPVLDVWSGESYHRPHAAKIWFYPEDEQANINVDWVVDGMIAALDDPRTRGVIWCDSCFARLPPRFSDEVRARFAPTGCGRLWLRKEEGK